MTSPARGGPDTAGMRGALVDELAGWPLGSGYYQYTVSTDDAQEMADHLLPVVQRLAVEKAAAELRAAADDWRSRDRNTDLWLRARADALAAAAQPTDGRTGE